MFAEYINQLQNLRKVFLFGYFNVCLKTKEMYMHESNSTNTIGLYCAVANQSVTIHEPRCEKTGLPGIRPVLTQTKLSNHRR